MNTTTSTQSQPALFIPVIALSLFAVASGYLMSLIPLMLSQYGIEAKYASWLASAFYGGLLVGAGLIEPFVARLGHKNAFVLFLGLLAVTIVVLPSAPIEWVWMTARFVAGIAVAGVFVVVESWLLIGDAESRPKRLGLYMGALYGGSSLGQLGIGFIGIEGLLPYYMIIGLIMMAIACLIFGKGAQPQVQHHNVLNLKQILKLNKASIMGCVVSGLLLGAVYGLMPLELKHRNINITQIGSLMALVVLGGMAVQPLVSYLSKHLGKTLLMALFCVLGVFAIGLTTLSDSTAVLATALVLLGMAAFALYPIAISLGCDTLDESYIVSATQVMLFSYSIGSVCGPVLANTLMNTAEGLMSYLFAILLATAIYMLLASLRQQRPMVAGE